MEIARAISEATRPAVPAAASLNISDIRTSVSTLKQACLDSGFFYVINHGISQGFMDEVFAHSKRLFDLPLEEKMRLLRNDKHRGSAKIRMHNLSCGNMSHH
ncbi:Mugineic-acid 3-dioxygenase [Acorus calamus]|uniref:Mugineic-acid 3-dioxygenase n=1 Tax=Acorus calamus TaxID=4465 RepID=A0AAV9EED4_ACOCL|nr:Mugineic-acid 3-dioxygenase [Acorus calamus]